MKTKKYAINKRIQYSILSLLVIAFGIGYSSINERYIMEFTPKTDIYYNNVEIKENFDNTMYEESIVNINKADKKELMELPGIGEKKGEEIIKFREEHGDFLKKEDLLNVSGIGDKTFLDIENMIKLSD